MSNKEIQIVAFDNPNPPDYGGAIDLYYKIKALNEIEVKVYLHMFYDDRTDVARLQPFCENITFYKRDKSFFKLFSRFPYAVNTRFSKDLIKNLNKISAPIFFETIKTTLVLKKHTFNQKIAIRCHNIEHHYSFGLMASETNLIKKLAYFFEGYKLKYYESILNKADIIYPLSYFEYSYFKKHYKSKTIFLPVFQENTKIEGDSGFGTYALYHGDLSLADNIKSVYFLINIFKDLDKQLIIASSLVKSDLINEVKKYQNITFKIVSGKDELDHLIKNAHINTLYSFQRSGTKLKVFNSLFKGRHCIVNKNMVDDPSVLKLCEIAENKAAYQDIVKKMFKTEYKKTEERFEILKKYDSKINAKLLVDTLF